jgi:hypothetical protein
LSLEELEAVRLADLLELDQEEAAFYMGISRKAFWNDLASARKKIATALIYGMGIVIEGGSYKLRSEDVGSSADQDGESAADYEMALMQREMELLSARQELIKSRIAGSRRNDGSRISETEKNTEYI